MSAKGLFNFSFALLGMSAFLPVNSMISEDEVQNECKMVDPYSCERTGCKKPGIPSFSIAKNVL
ncbi:hypothetical protein CVN76_21400, partial [Bacillus sp. mrc49]